MYSPTKDAINDPRNIMDLQIPASLRKRWRPDAISLIIGWCACAFMLMLVYVFAGVV